ncbi:MAG: hypothetical protein GWP08_20375 [Nitrospiraceae bacterium]|nr:hypothetical protein [Nitrospiraceae bacterium]
MKHLRFVTQRPVMAQAGTTGGTAFEVKINFLVNLVDRAIMYAFQKETAL